MSEPILIQDSDAFKTLAYDHYENFPVAKLFIPRHLRKAVSTVYAFARIADDYADEGNFSAQQRLKYLSQLDHEIDQPNSRLMQALVQIIADHKLNKDAFHQLLTAFKNDVVKLRYTNEKERFWYCRHSANPIGEILLDLFEQNTPDNKTRIDKLCTLLQLLNFYQDIYSDYTKRNRIYLLQIDLQKHDLSLNTLFKQRQNKSLQARAHKVMMQELLRCKKMVKEIQPVIYSLQGPLKYQTAVTLACAQTLIHLLEKRSGALWKRPKIKFWHLPNILKNTVINLIGIGK